jgi:phage tail-like protein
MSGQNSSRDEHLVYGNTHSLGGFIMADKVPDIVVGAYWRVDVQGKVVGIFSGYEGGGSKNKLVEHRYVNAQGQPMIKYEPGPLELTPIKLSRGLTGSKEMLAWRELVEKGKIVEARCNASIIMLNNDGSEVARFNYINMWPSEMTTSKLDPKVGEAVVETITLVYEEVTYTRTGQTPSS